MNINHNIGIFPPLLTQNALELPLSILGAISPCTPSTELVAQLLAEQDGKLLPDSKPAAEYQLVLHHHLRKRILEATANMTQASSSNVPFKVKLRTLISLTTSYTVGCCMAQPIIVFFPNPCQNLYTMALFYYYCQRQRCALQVCIIHNAGWRGRKLAILAFCCERNWLELHVYRQCMNM